MQDINFPELTFQRGSSGRVKFDQMVSEIKGFIKENKEAKYSIFIGTDSQTKENNGLNLAEFVSAVVVYRQGFGGRYFWRSIKTASFKNLRDRIWQEVMISLKLAETLVELFSSLKDALLNFELHIDVGNNGPTKALIQELVNTVRSSGFNVKTKPASFAASKVADRYL